MLQLLCSHLFCFNCLHYNHVFFCNLCSFLCLIIGSTTQVMFILVFVLSLWPLLNVATLVRVQSFKNSLVCVML